MKFVIGWLRESSRVGPFGCSTCTSCAIGICGSASNSRPRSQFGASPRPAKPVPRTHSAGSIGTRSIGTRSIGTYDERIVSFKANDFVSIWRLEGRLKIKSVMGKRQRDLLAHRKRELDLMLIRGRWYLACACDIVDPDEIKTTKVLGVDLGTVNLATDRDGRLHTGEKVETVRKRMPRRRAGLQRRSSKAAKRKLRQLSGKQRRVQSHENHCISKAIVLAAQRSGRAIGLEDLKGIRERVKASRPQRARLGHWSFGPLQTFVACKARRAGIPVLFVAPKYPSKGCPACGAIDDKNRANQATFSCISCRHAGHADVIAARNIRCRAEAALVTRP
jgi:putative transposase